MQKLITATVAVLLFAAVGCKSHDKTDACCTTQKVQKDACPMCPGTQSAKADGTCEKCGMKPPA